MLHRLIKVILLPLLKIMQKLKFNDYFVYVHAQDLARREDLNNALANCFEAVLGAMYMDGGLQVTREFLARTLFEDQELQNIWLNFPAHPLQGWCSFPNTLLGLFTIF